MKLVWAGRLLGVVAILALTVVTTTADEGNVSARAKLSGFQENLPKLTDGAGTFEATIKGGTLSYKLTYSGLSSDAFMSHIHFGQPTVNGGIFLWPVKLFLDELARMRRVGGERAELAVELMQPARDGARRGGGVDRCQRWGRW